MEDKTAKQQKFIELRAKGNSFDSIAKRLKVSKGTLISWSKTFEIDIGNYANIEADLVLEKYKMYKLNQLEEYGVQLKKIRDELGKRDFTDIPTLKLMEMGLKITESINKNERNSVIFKAEGVGSWINYESWKAE